MRPARVTWAGTCTGIRTKVGQALGLRRPLRPPGRAFNNLRWVFDRARVLQEPLFAQRNQLCPSTNRPTWTSAAGQEETCPTNARATPPTPLPISNTSDSALGAPSAGWGDPAPACGVPAPAAGGRRRAKLAPLTPGTPVR